LAKRFGGLFHVTDWLPTLYAMAGGDYAALSKEKGFRQLDGVNQMPFLLNASASSVASARDDILHNIEGINGSAAAVLRMGDFKLLQRMQGGGGAGWCDVCAASTGCVVPQVNGSRGHQTSPTHNVSFGGQLCCDNPPVIEKGAAVACNTQPAPVVTKVLLFNIKEDPSESKDLSQDPAHQSTLQSISKRLAEHAATNVPCCICTGRPDQAEMSIPPKDGYWFTFRDQSDNMDPACALMRQPPPAPAPTPPR
jgi:hypothetical protein